MKYGNIIYSKRNGRLNLGDDIQLLAIENLYKMMNVDYKDVVRIEFAELYTWEGEELVVPISFPIISYNKQMNITCFSPKIYPVFLALSILTESLGKRDIEYLKCFAPIGCRDAHTLKVMKKYDIPAYLFGCMTMTFPKVWKEDGDKDKVFCVDISEKLSDFIPSDIKKDCVYLSNAYDIEEIVGKTEDKAREVYDLLINKARLVITARMHVALPCVAAGIPVVFAKDLYSYRFMGINRIVKIYSEDEYSLIDWCAEPLEYEEYKQKMIKLAILRVRNKFNEQEEITNYNKCLSNTNMREGVIESVYNTEQYLEGLFSRDDEFEYIIWSVTQTADQIYNLVSTKWNKAKLVAVVDRSKRVDFHGIFSSSKEVILLHKNAIVLVCSDAAISEAKIYFSENNIISYYYCCLNNMTLKR